MKDSGITESQRTILCLKLRRDVQYIHGVAQKGRILATDGSGFAILVRELREKQRCICYYVHRPQRKLLILSEIRTFHLVKTELL
jgi:hypothetical protein